MPAPTGPPVPAELRGSEEVARLGSRAAPRSLASGARRSSMAEPARWSRFPIGVMSVVAFTIVGDRVTEMDLLVDPIKLRNVRV